MPFTIAKVITDARYEDEPVLGVLKRRAARIFNIDGEVPESVSPEEEMAIFLGELEDAAGITQVVIRTHPGAGKSRDATEFVDDMYINHGKKGLYLMLTHEAINERMSRLEADEKAEHWRVWKRHEDDCERNKFNDAGYFGHGKCACREGQFTADYPTLATIEYVLPGSPTSNEPLVKAVEYFDFWIIDEMDFNRLLDDTSVSQGDVKRVAETHPDANVKALCSAIDKVMDLMLKGSTERLNGERLHKQLDKALDVGGESLSGLHLDYAKLPHEPWLEGEKLPHNFPPKLLPVLNDELNRKKTGKPFQPRIHLVKVGDRVELRIWWRKDFSDYYYLDVGEGHWLVDDYRTPPIFVMDATADQVCWKRYSYMRERIAVRFLLNGLIMFTFNNGQMVWSHVATI